MGVTKVHDAAELAAAVEVALRYDEWVVVEEAIIGREIELAVLGNREPRVSVPGEIVPGAEFYDYEDKYLDGRAKLLVPAPLPADVAERFQALALRRLPGRCGPRAWPGSTSSTRRRARPGGRCSTRSTRSPASPRSRCTPSCGRRPALPYAQLIDELVGLAVERWRRRAPAPAPTD